MIDLVTGGAGFVGGHVVAALRAAGREVRVLDPVPPGPDAGATWIEGSVLDHATVARAMDGVERVFHLAAIPDLWIRDPRAYDQVNVEGTRVVVAAALQAGVRRFVHTSSEVVLVPGAGRRTGLLDESVELAPEATIGAYARSKRRAELVVLEAVADGLPAVLVLPTAPLGPGDHRRTPPTRMLADLLAGRLPAWLDCVFGLVDVRDAAAAHLLASEHGSVGARYLIAGHDVAMADFLRLVGRLSGRSMPRMRVPASLALAGAAAGEAVARLGGPAPQGPLDGVRLALATPGFDGSRARTELGFVPRPLEDTVRDAIAWLREAEASSTER